MTTLALAIALGGCAGDRDNPFAGGDAEGDSTTASEVMGTSTSGGPGGGPDGGPGNGTLDEDSGGAEETGFGMDDDMPLVTTVPSVKQGTIDLGTYVLLEKVLVTAPTIAVGPGVRDLYVQDREGGLYSGIRISGGESSYDLRPGDLVDVLGRVRDLGGFRFIEGNADFIVEEGDPPPLEVDVNDLLPGSVAEEVFEGVLIRLHDLKVSADDDGTPLLDTLVRLDARFAEDLPPVEPGTALWSIVGVLTMTPDGLAIAPRSAGDLDQ